VVLQKSGYTSTVATLRGFCAYLPGITCADSALFASTSRTRYQLLETAELLDLTLFRIAPHAAKMQLYNNGAWTMQPLLKEFKTVSGPQRGEDRSLILAEQFSEHATATSNKPTFKFIHLLIPHAPMRFTRDCNFTKQYPQMNRASMLEQSRCAIKAAMLIISKMKELSAFDTSTIVIMADHGNKVKTLPRPSGVTLPYQRIEMALPLLLIKPKHSNAPLITSNVPATLSDIPKTIADTLRLTESYPGYNLLSSAEIPSDRVRSYSTFTYRWGAWKDTDTSSSLGAFEQYHIHGDSWLPESWQKAP
jgi:hypothetical protein